MQDVETKSLWSQVTGECIVGDEKGAMLDEFPVSHTTYAAYKKQYPQGLILVKETRGDKGTQYKDYLSDPTKMGLFGRTDNFTRLDGKDFVFGLRQNGRAVAISRSAIAKSKLVLVDQFERPILVAFDPTNESVSAFDLEALDSLDLTKMSIADDGSAVSIAGMSWNAQTGVSLDGKSSDLRRYPVITAYWFAWLTFFPETDLIK